jgi:predicted nucleic acid-binding protein
MEQGTVISLDKELSVDAAYCGVEHGLPLADSIVYATAQKYNATLWTQDADFKDLKDVKYYSK